VKSFFQALRHGGVLAAIGLGTAGFAPAQQPQLDSHEVNADRSITFRYYAPTAQKVELRLDYDPNPVSLQKGADGVWTLQTAPLPPALHIYGLSVDGVSVLDPFNKEVDPTYFFMSNFVHVPGPPQVWDAGAVPHGVLHHHEYRSSAIAHAPEGLEDFYVYTPPGYDAAKGTRYPVLYLLHGWAGKADSWVADGQANFILDNLIAQGRAKPMLVVMPLAYGDLDFVTKGPGQWKDSANVNRNISLFSQALLTEILPQVEAGYRTGPGRANRAIAGLSMGGGESLTIGLNHPDVFGAVAGLSSALAPEPYATIFPHLTSASHPKPNLLWIACGTEDGLLAPNRQFIAWLKTQGLAPTAIETPGIHNWPVWRDDLVRLAPLLFRSGVTAGN
jgi:enterochelin esterase family protein